MALEKDRADALRRRWISFPAQQTGHPRHIVRRAFPGRKTDWFPDGVVPKNTASNTVLPDLFTTITLPTDMTNELIKNLEGVTISVTAEAIQADTFANANAAWTAFG